MDRGTGSTIRRRAFTLVELLVVLGVGAIVLLGLGLLYAFTMHQVGATLAELSATDQATTAMQAMQWSVRNAFLCESETKNGSTALRCSMPTLEIYLNDPTTPVGYRGSQVDKFGREAFQKGNRVWYYLADSTGVWGTSGTTLWRAIRSDDNDPTASDLDLAFTYEYSSAATPRFPLINGFTFTVDATNDLVSLSLSADGVDYARHAAGSSDVSGQSRSIVVSQQAFWENWRVAT